MTLNGDGKFKGKLTRDLKNDIRNLVNFHGSCRKSENLHFDGLLLTFGSKNYMRNLVNFNASSSKSKDLHFDVLLLSKLYYVWPKNIQRSYVHIKLKNDAKFEEELTCALNNDMGNLANFDPTLQSLKICSLMGPLWPKYIMFDLERYRGVIRHYTEDRCKLWRKNDLCFHKWHEEFGEICWSTQKS